MVKWAAHASNWQPALSLQLSVSLVSLVLRLVRRHHHCPLLWKSLFVAGHGRIWPCSEETSNGGRAPDWLWPRFSIADVVGSIVITFLTFVLQACHTAQSSISVYFSSVLLLCAIKTLSNGFGWFWNPSSQQAKCCLCESERFLVLGARGVTKVYLKIFMNMIMNVFKGTIGFGMLCSRHRWQTHATISEDVQFLPERPDRRPPGPPPKAPQQVQSDCPVTWYCIATLEWRSRELKFKTFRTKKYILYIIHYIIYIYIYNIHILYVYCIHVYMYTDIDNTLQIITVLKCCRFHHGSAVPHGNITVNSCGKRTGVWKELGPLLFPSKKGQTRHYVSMYALGWFMCVLYVMKYSGHHTSHQIKLCLSTWYSRSERISGSGAVSCWTHAVVFCMEGQRLCRCSEETSTAKGSTGERMPTPIQYPQKGRWYLTSWIWVFLGQYPMFILDRCVTLQEMPSNAKPPPPPPKKAPAGWKMLERQISFKLPLRGICCWKHRTDTHRHSSFSLFLNLSRVFLILSALEESGIFGKLDARVVNTRGAPGAVGVLRARKCWPSHPYRHPWYQTNIKRSQWNIDTYIE